MPKTKGVSNTVDKWQRRASVAQPDYVAGVQNPRVPWDQAAKAAEIEDAHDAVVDLDQAVVGELVQDAREVLGGHVQARGDHVLARREVDLGTGRPRARAASPAGSR